MPQSRTPFARLVQRLVAAAPDLVTAAFCMAAWWAPLALPADLVRSTALIMMIEFLMIHAWIIVPFSAMLVRPGLAMLAMGLAALLYVLFAIGFSLALDTWWPTLMFIWLLLSHYVFPLWSDGGRETPLIDPGKLWLVSLLLWIPLAFVTVLLPLPALGWSGVVPPEWGLPGTGIWVAAPYRLLAFAVIYFSLLAVFKFVAADVHDSPSRPVASLAQQRHEAREAGARAMAERKQRLDALRKKRSEE